MNISLFLRRLNCFKWHQVALCLVVLCYGFAAPVYAAEAYSTYAKRLVNNPPETALIREDLAELLVLEANQFRKSKKAKALARGDETLQLAARAHAIDMIKGDFVGHTATTGQGFEQRMRSFFPGQMVLGALAENAARERSKGPPDAAKLRKLFQQWIKSGSHRRTLESRTYTRVATAVVQKGDHLYAVQIFAGPPVKTNMNFGKPPEPPTGLY